MPKIASKGRLKRWVALSLGIAVLVGWLAYASIFVHRIHRGRPEVLTPEVKQLAEQEYKEEWFAIFQNGLRAGYSHTRLRPERDGYALHEELFLRLDFLDEIQDVFSTIEAQLAPDFSVRSFAFRLQAGLISFRLNGRVDDGQLTLVSTMAGQEQSQQLPLSQPIYLGSGMKSFVCEQKLQVGNTYRLMLFDPATMSRTAVPVHVEARETIRVRSRNLEAYRVVTEFHGIKLRTWISPYGELLKEEGFLGMTMVRTDGEDALRSLTEATAAELVREAAVVPDRAIGKPRKLTRVRLRIKGITGDDWDLTGGRQWWNKDELTIVRESVQEIPSVSIPWNRSEMARDLQPDLLIQSDTREIREQAAAIVDGERDGLRATVLLSDWVYDYLEKRPTLSIPNALEVYKRRAGDCNEHSVLFAALARAVGIPTRIAAGLVYVDGRFFYHAWNEVFVGEWVAVDSLMNQVPADPTHVRLVIGNLDRQVQLVRVIGRLRIQVLEYE
ncbi:MAG: transglutaminase domain-containing protein [Deltaproteobacteria bacterium]|nr:MAG: transglutaminase domain-containing protein [Deltaproteobacteria bacterium]